MTKRKRETGPGLYRIGAVAEMTGISAHALRAWERRYKEAFEPSRASGGARLYTENEVNRLRLLKQLLDRGNSVRPLVGLSLEQLERALEAGTERGRPAPVSLGGRDLRERAKAALARLDVVEADRLLSRAIVEKHGDRVILDTVIPLLEELCEDWDAGTMKRAHEFLYGTVFRGLLCTLMRLRPASAQAGRVLVTTLPGEPHEFAALVTAFVAVLHGWRTYYVGPLLQAQEVLDAQKMTGAQHLVIAFMEAPSADTSRDLRTLLRKATPGTKLAITGRGTDQVDATSLPEGLQRVEGLEALNEYFARSPELERAGRKAAKQTPSCSV